MRIDNPSRRRSRSATLPDSGEAVGERITTKRIVIHKNRSRRETCSEQLHAESHVKCSEMPSGLWVELLRKLFVATTDTTERINSEATPPDDLGIRLKRWRLTRGLSRREAALLLNTKVEYILFIESGF